MRRTVRSAAFKLCLASLLVICLFPALAKAQGLTISSYEILGNQEISDQVILLALESKIGDLFSTELVRKDRESLRNLGYFQFADVEPSITPDRGVIMRVRVVENPIVTGIQIEGAELVTTKEILDVVTVRPGIVLNWATLQESFAAINHLYQERGWVFCGILDRNRWKLDPATGVLSFAVSEPKLRKVEVKGNHKTQRKVILRELEVEKGKPLKRNRVQRSMRNVYNLRYFADVKPPAPEFDDNYENVDLDFVVKEQKTGTASFGGGYSSVNGMIGFVDVAETNFRGRGQTLRTKVMFGGESQRQIDFVEPWFRNRPVSMGLSLYNTTIDREEIVDATVASRFEEKRKGYGLRTGWRIARDTRLSLGFTDEDITATAQAITGTTVTTLPTDLTALDLDNDLSVEYPQQVIRLTWTKDARDNFMDAAKGYRLSLSYVTSGRWLQGITGYHRYIADWRQYFGLIKPKKKLTLAYRLRAGFTDITDGELRFTDRFIVGGAESIRGYEDREFTGAKFAYANIELRHKLSNMFGLVYFYDFGDAWGADTVDQTSGLTTGDPFDMRSAFGLGFRLTTPIGPFRFDWARARDRGARLHFGIGHQF